MPVRTLLRQVVMLGVPLAGAVLTLFHPKQPLAALFQDAALRQTWLTVHVLQLFLFALLAVVVFLLLDGKEGGIATAARLAMFGFAVFYGTYDGLAGIATGVLAANAAGMPDAGQAGALQAAQGLFFAMEEGSLAWIGLLGTFFWVVGLFATGIVLARSSRVGLALGLALLAALLSTFGTQVWHPLHIVSAVVGGLALLLSILGARGAVAAGNLSGRCGAGPHFRPSCADGDNRLWVVVPGSSCLATGSGQAGSRDRCVCRAA